MIWSPSTEQEIVDAAANGLLTETHYLDLKRELSPGNAGNKERMRHSEPYSEDRYEASAAASLMEINSTPQRVVEDLVGPLLRSLNSRALFPELDAR